MCIRLTFPKYWNVNTCTALHDIVEDTICDFTRNFFSMCETASTKELACKIPAFILSVTKGNENVHEA